MSNWLAINKIENWDFSVLLGFQYDDIPDEHIEDALNDSKLLPLVDAKKDWEDDHFLAETPQIPDARKHAYRVAAIIDSIRRGERISHAIELSTFANGNCVSCVTNGHHRIRAFQFLGLTAAPFSLDGMVDELERLVTVAGTEPSDDMHGIFEESLFEKDDCHILPLTKNARKRNP